MERMIFTKIEPLKKFMQYCEENGGIEIDPDFLLNCENEIKSEGKTCINHTYDSSTPRYFPQPSQIQFNS